METHANRLDDNVSLLAESMGNWLAWLDRHESSLEERDKADLLRGLRGLRQVVAGAALPGVKAFRNSVDNVRELSDVLDVAGEQLTVVLNSIIDSMERLLKLSDDTERQLGN